MSISIIKAGLYCSVQDQGRPGFQRVGVPVGGCMDKYAASVANILCGNAHDFAVVEFLMHGASIRFDSDHLVAFAGSGAIPTWSNRELPIHRAIFVPGDTVIDLRYTDKGCRLYLALAGGVDTPLLLGSRSTYEPAGIGSRISAGDKLPVGVRSEVAERMIGQLLPAGIGSGTIKGMNGGILPNGPSVSKWGAVELLEEMDTDCIRILRGPEWDYFSEHSRKKWLSTYFQITQASDRMGYTLIGEGISLAVTREMISTAVTTGTIQVVPDGSPLLLMADAQTTGGYPRIAQVIEADIALCAQKRPGDKIRFREVSEAVAHQLFINRVEERKRIEKTIGVKFCI